MYIEYHKKIEPCLIECRFKYFNSIYISRDNMTQMSNNSISRCKCLHNLLISIFFSFFLRSQLDNKTQFPNDISLFFLYVCMYVELKPSHNRRYLCRHSRCHFFLFEKGKKKKNLNSTNLD